jgi:DNA-binding beta-propeller fold protein YncE
MKSHLWILAAVLTLFSPKAQGQEKAPLKLVQTLTFPAEVAGNFDHLTVDLQGNRLFTTPEDYKAVVVFDLKTGNVSHTISGVGRPHAVLYREDLNRIYVTDGAAGDLKIYDGADYRLLSTVKLLEDADSIGYESKTKYLYVDNGGGDIHETYSMLSVIDTTAGTKLADIKIDGDTLEAMALEESSARLFVNNRAKGQVDVIDRNKRELTASWPVMCKPNVAMAFDEANHRLFVGCRDGKIAVLDTQTGKELKALPITKGVDDIVYDAGSKRLYASCDGDAAVYAQTSPDDYKLLGKVPTGPLGRTSRLVPELNRYFVAVPKHGTTNASVLVFEVQ